MKAKFITFEGSEGCGKSTQSKLLRDYLRGKGFKIVYLREPGGTPIAEKIRRILLNPQNKEMSRLTELLLYMASRAQAIEEIIRPALLEGKVVISDRFLDSTLAYQGFGLGLNLKLIREIAKFYPASSKPDLTLLLDLPVKKGLRYRKLVRDRIEKRSLAYHTRVRRGYLKLARLEPQRIKVIRVEKKISATQEKIRKTVMRLLG